MIVYSVVSRQSDASILCEYSTDNLTGNAPQCTAALLEHLRDHPNILKKGDLKTLRHSNKASSSSGGGGGGSCGNDEDFFSQFLQACTVAITTAEEMDLGTVDEYFFHLWHQEEIFYCCLSDDKDPRHQKVNFAFLQAISHDFGGKYSQRKIRNANSYAFDKDFKPTLRSTMHHYNIRRKELIREDNAQIDQLMTKVEDLKSVMGRNLTLLLERDEHLDNLMNKASKARQDSMVFKRKSIKAKRQMEMKSYKMWFLICFSILIFLYFIITSACGFRFEQCRSNSGD
ncbi:MAG: vesicle-associated membrane protein 7 [Bacillariaceae sp.]|jgi:vesicle-associated membrane protein 7